MIPEESLSPTPVEGPYLYPDSIPRETRLEDYASGGQALGDPLPSMFYQGWKCWLDIDKVYLSPEPYDQPQLLFTVEPENVALVTDLAFALDKNMDWNVMLAIGTLGRFRWYDPVAEEHQILDIPGICSPRLTLDDKRISSNTINDILMFYLKGATLYYRQQRDRYTIERPLGTFPGILGLGRAGMTEILRVQIETLFDAAWTPESQDPNWQPPEAINPDWGACDDIATSWGNCDGE